MANNTNYKNEEHKQCPTMTGAHKEVTNIMGQVHFLHFQERQNWEKACGELQMPGLMPDSVVPSARLPVFHTTHTQHKVIA